MLDLHWIRDNADAVREGARKKRIAFDVDRLLQLDEERRAAIKLHEEAKAEQNALGKQVPTLEGDARTRPAAGVAWRVKAPSTSRASMGP